MAEAATGTTASATASCSARVLTNALSPIDRRVTAPSDACGTATPLIGQASLRRTTAGEGAGTTIIVGCARRRRRSPLRRHRRRREADRAEAEQRRCAAHGSVADAGLHAPAVELVQAALRVERRARLGDVGGERRGECVAERLLDQRTHD